MAQEKCIFEYCNFGNGYLRVSFPSKDGSDSKDFTIDLEDYSVSDGVITRAEPLAERIRFEMDKLGISSMPSVCLVLRCAEVYKTTMSIPVKISIAAGYLYNKEMKVKVDKERYYTITDSYKRGIGYAYNTYFVPKAIVDSFSKITKLLSSDVTDVEVCGMHVFETLDHPETYVYLYIRRKVCTLILASEKDLITSFDFEFESAGDIRQKILIIASKHELEFERIRITHYGIDSDEPIALNIGLARLGDPVAEDGGAVEYSAAEIESQDSGELEVDIENYDDDKTIFSKRYGDASTVIRTRYDALSKTLLNYTDMKCRVTEQCAVFHINSEVYARMDIRNSRVMLYLPLDPKKYIDSRYPCALTKRRGFDNTPCLYRIATAFRYDGAYTLIDDLATERGLVPKS